MKLKISIALNVVLFVLVLFLGYFHVNYAVSDFYYRKTVGIVASRAVVELEKGNTNLVHDALACIQSDTPDSLALEKAGSKLGVITMPK
jgi:hypothetical protein